MYIISLVFAVTGLGIIHVSSQKIMPEKVAVEDISASMSGEIVSTEGKVASKSFSGGNLFLNLGNGGEEIKIVMFDTENRFKEGQNITVEGEVAIYRGELEIIADEIKKK